MPADGGIAVFSARMRFGNHPRIPNRYDISMSVVDRVLSSIRMSAGQMYGSVRDSVFLSVIQRSCSRVTIASVGT
jgi:hypothetical protein